MSLFGAVMTTWIVGGTIIVIALAIQRAIAYIRGLNTTIRTLTLDVGIYRRLLGLHRHHDRASEAAHLYELRRQRRYKGAPLDGRQHHDHR